MAHVIINRSIRRISASTRVLAVVMHVRTTLSVMEQCPPADVMSSSKIATHTARGETRIRVPKQLVSNSISSSFTKWDDHGLIPRQSCLWALFRGNGSYKGPSSLLFSRDVAGSHSGSGKGSEPDKYVAVHDPTRTRAELCRIKWKLVLIISGLNTYIVEDCGESTNTAPIKYMHQCDRLRWLGIVCTPAWRPLTDRSEVSVEESRLRLCRVEVLFVIP